MYMFQRLFWHERALKQPLLALLEREEQKIGCSFDEATLEQEIPHFDLSLCQGRGKKIA